jgi:hypothetical protein
VLRVVLLWGAASLLVHLLVDCVLHQLPRDGSMPQQLGEGQVVQSEEAAYAL